MSCSELSSPTSIPERCHKPCEKVCDVPEICCPCKPQFEPCEIYGMFKDAVVTVDATWIFVAGETVGAPITGATPLANNSRVEVTLISNGTIIRKKKKDGEKKDKKRGEGCKKRSVRIMVPFHAVFAPPAITSGAVTYPYKDGDDAVELGRIRNEYVPASRILVTVNNVNLKGRAQYYIADIVGGHGSGDHAYLDISFDCHNKHCMVIEKCHPHISLGNSNHACPGTEVVMIGNFTSSQTDRFLASSDVSLVTGIVADNKFMDPTGTFLYQALIVNTGVYGNRSGIPILDRSARLIGMQTLNVSGVDRSLVNAHIGNGLVGGPSICSMRHAFKIIMEGARTRHSNNQLAKYCGSNGQFWIFTPGALLFSYRVATARDYDSTVDYTSGSPVAGQHRTRLDDSGQFINGPRVHCFGGIVVTGLAGLNPNDASGVPNGHYYVPGGAAAAPLPIDLPKSPLISKIKPGDIITSIDGCPIGALAHQNIPSSILWPGTFELSDVEVTWLIGGNVLNQNNNNEEYENYTRDCQKFRACVEILPPVLDYPYASVTQFPNVTGALYPSVTLPVTQTQYPLFPSLSTPGAGIFAPAV